MIEVPLPDMPAGPSPEEILLVGLRKRYLELGAQIETYENERAVIKERVRRLGRGAHPVGDGKITISPNNRFDPKLAEQVLTEINPDLVAACSTTKIDSSLVKKAVGDDIYERCQKAAGDDKVTIA